MAPYRLSRLAETDLLEICIYTERVWGQEQALRYLAALEACCQRVATKPNLGRECDYIRPGLRRIEYEHHGVFYRQESGGLLISRILHERMLPSRHQIDDIEE